MKMPPAHLAVPLDSTATCARPSHATQVASDASNAVRQVPRYHGNGGSDDLGVIADATPRK
jgi:hypothetical protein